MESVSAIQIFKAIPMTPVLWVIFGISVLIFTLYSGMLLWHWKLYSTGKFTTVSNALLYLSVSIGFIFVMGFSIIWYSISS
jgi:hypothetical protein